MSLLNYRIIPLSLCCLLLSACNSVNFQPATTTNTQVVLDDTPQETELPESIYHPLKKSATPIEVTAGYQLARNLFAQGDYQQTIDRLELNVLNIDSPLQFDGYLLAALASSELSNTPQAFQFLRQAEALSSAAHPDHQNELKDTAASIYENTHNWISAVRMRLDLSYNLPLDEQAFNEEKLWLDIQNLNQNEVSVLYLLEEPTLNGWLQISDILRDQTLSTDQQLNAFNEWQLDNPFHPASQTPPKDFHILSTIEEMAPEKIVLMLPMSGKLEQASQAIVSGFLVSYYNQKNSRPEVLIVDIDQFDNVEDALSAANEKQPDIIIGPLQKSNVATISRQNLTTPVIALNQLDQLSPNNRLFHLSLNADDEIRELINFSKKEGATTAAILSTQDTWAQKQGDDFYKMALEANIQVVSRLDYADTPKGRQGAVQKLLLIDKSLKRKASIERWTGEQVEGIARSRTDLDYVYYVGRLGDAKQIRPLLDFYFADDIPMLATSSLNDSTPEKSSNSSDFERILFTEAPALSSNDNALFTLRKTTKSNILRRLQALGADAYLLANKHKLFTLLPSTKISANTGIITLGDDGTFHKRPEVMTYRKGNLVYADSEQFFPQEESRKE
ncbi:penicillin-binding protein activator [Marinomonas sp. C2222]|uniref:Penicillin-binding protein activator n=1 Tax=Marinomonas sargassi TaxID=2984494 RepID=A0ABT2YT38_9GAMM|nr:penicillin-binding protein activator [Marinomonas sargassi]MCV2403038.1 penicillin-binding protein activator [Marinomonas sargassi]